MKKSSPDDSFDDISEDDDFLLTAVKTCDDDHHSTKSDEDSILFTQPRPYEKKKESTTKKRPSPVIDGNKHSKRIRFTQESVQEIKKLGPDARRKIEIHEARAIAHDKDRNYDEAVADLRAAIELTSKARMSRDKVQELETKLREAQESESKWNRLRDRDHVAVLDLPENIDEVKDLKRKCQWLKKNYRKMTVKWHPDRTKETTNEKRAGRKFDEVNKAYEVRSNIL